MAQLAPPVFPGKLIVFEGNEGCGKSTLVNYALSVLDSSGIKVNATRSPGGHVVSEMLREAALMPEATNKASVHIFIAAIIQNYEAWIRPKLEAGEWVIADRMYSSTIAYQIYGNDMEAEDLNAAKNAMDHIVPDLELFVKVNDQERKQRLANRGLLNKFDRMTDQFATRVDLGYKDCYEFHSWARDKRYFDNTPAQEVSKANLKTLLEGFVGRPLKNQYED